MNWSSCTYGGVTYTFHHLVPFTFVAHGMRIRVSCGAHAFTRKPLPADPPHMLFMDGRTPRTFEPTRYAFSTHLPAILMREAAGAVYSNAGRYVFKGSIPGVAGAYVIAFDLRVSNSPKYDFKVQIVSAHNAAKSKKMPKADFVDLLHGLSSGGAVQWTKK